MRQHATSNIEIKLKPSKILLGCYSLISIVSLFSLYVLPIGQPLKWLATLLVIIATFYVVLRDALLRLPWSWQKVCVQPSGAIVLYTHKQTLEVDLLNSSVNHPYLVVLNFKRISKQFGFQQAVYLTHYRVKNPDQLRQLRVWLNWRKTDTGSV